jgi:hypothetical protein
MTNDQLLGSPPPFWSSDSHGLTLTADAESLKMGAEQSYQTARSETKRTCKGIHQCR